MPNTKKIKVVIDRSKWRTGHESRHCTGRGDTKLLNTEGYMCCLGFCCKASRVGVNRIQDRTRPRSIIEPPQTTGYLPQRVLKLRGLRALLDITEQNGKVTATCNSFTDSAIAINDNSDTTPREKEKQLLELFKDSVFELEFTGEYAKPFFVLTQSKDEDSKSQEKV
jgi:hypothetical protein